MSPRLPLCHAVLIVGLLVTAGEASAQEVTTISFKGVVVTGPLVGIEVYGSARFPTDQPDLIAGGLEDWWEVPSAANFTFAGGGIDFTTTSGSFSSLRIKDRPEEDALRYDGISGSTSLLLLLSGGGVDALLSGSGGLSGVPPVFAADPSVFIPCAQDENGSYSGSCSMFATSDGAMLFQLTEFSIGSPSPNPEDLLADLIDHILASNLPAGTTTSLVAKLNAVLDAIGDQHEDEAVSSLGAFMNAVRAQRGKALSETQAESLISSAQAVIDAIRAGDGLSGGST